MVQTKLSKSILKKEKFKMKKKVHLQTARKLRDGNIFA